MTGPSRRAVLAGAGAALIAPRARAATETIPLDITPAGFGFVTAKVGDRSVRALVDTGSLHPLQVSSRLAASLKTTSPGRFTLGGRSSSEPMPVEPEIERVATEIGTEFDAVIGWPYLSRAPFALDYAASSLVLDDTVDPASVWRVSLVGAAPLPVIDAILDGRPLRVLVDTGVPTSMLDPRRADSPVGVMLERALTIGGRETRMRFRVKDLGAIRTALGCDAVLGHAFLGGFRVRFDRAGGRLSLQN